MAVLSNREIKQELDNLKKVLVAGGGGASVEITTGVPIVSGRESNGDLAFDTTNDNLYIFSQGSYEVTSEKLFERYALNVTNTNNEGKVSNTSDVEEFSVNPKDSSGNDLPWKGTILSNAASEVSTDYVWVNIKGETGETGADGDPAVNIHIEVVGTGDNAFRNNAGSDKQLRANVFVGGTILTTAQHNSLDYLWYEDGVAITGGTNRIYTVSAGDVPNDSSNGYTCTVSGTYT